VATFVVQSTQNLLPNYDQISASLLTELVGIQRAAEANGNLSAVSRSSLDINTPFKAAPADVWINTLWFISLMLTLLTAVITGLVQQWLRYYVADVNGTPKKRALTRHFRY
jgi:hypothetical protein